MNFTMAMVGDRLASVVPLPLISYEPEQPRDP